MAAGAAESTHVSFATLRRALLLRQTALISSGISLGITLGSIALGLLVSVCIIAAAGHNPFDALNQIWQGAFGSRYAVGNTFNVATPLLFVAVAFIIGYRAGLINVGGEGQIYLGGAAAAAVALKAWQLPPFAALGASLIAAAAAGALWSGLAGVWRARFGINEIISTLLMNFIAIEIVSYLVKSPSLLQEPPTGVLKHLPQSDLVPANARLPQLFPDDPNRLHLGFFIAIGVAVLAAALYRYTNLGLQLRMMGHNVQAARQAGVSVAMLIVVAMLLSGAAGGLAGGDLVLGDQYRILNGLSPGYGFDGIVVALLARSSALNAIAAALLFAALRTGGLFTETAIAVPSAIIYVIEGVVILTVVGASYYVQRLRFARAAA